MKAICAFLFAISVLTYVSPVFASVYSRADMLPVRVQDTDPSQEQNLPLDWLKEGEFDKALAAYQALKASDPEQSSVQESSLISLGYDRWNGNRLEEAIGIFRIASTLYPKSSNAMNSLGQAQIANGNRELGKQSLKKSLELNPRNENAKIALKNVQTKDEAESNFFKTFSTKQYIDDLENLARVLTETHPHPYLFTPKEQFWKLIDETKKSISSATTTAEFIWMCSEVTACISCSHTSLGWFKQETKMLPVNLMFPMEAKLIDDRLYVSDALINSDRIQIGVEIFSINGKPVEEIKSEIYRHINSQGKSESYKRILLNAYVTSYIPYALGFPDSYEIVVKGNLAPIRLSNLKTYKHKPRISKKAKCQKNLCLHFLEKDNVAVMTVRSFAYYGKEREKEFKSFVDESAAKIAQHDVDNLIIDLRMNGGGSAFASTYLLKHLVKQPFTYFAPNSANNTEFDYKQPITPSDKRFDGNVIVLMDGDGHSSTGHFLSFVKDRKLATLVGEELGSNHFCTAAQKQFVLDNTLVTFSVARNTWFTPVEGLPIDRGIFPDHAVVQSIDDCQNDIDTVMNYALGLINDNETER